MRPRRMACCRWSLISQPGFSREAAPAVDEDGGDPFDLFPLQLLTPAPMAHFDPCILSNKTVKAAAFTESDRFALET